MMHLFQVICVVDQYHLSTYPMTLTGVNLSALSTNEITKSSSSRISLGPEERVDTAPPNQPLRLLGTSIDPEDEGEGITRIGMGSSYHTRLRLGRTRVSAKKQVPRPLSGPACSPHLHMRRDVRILLVGDGELSCRFIYFFIHQNPNRGRG
jgi:hypothetical protein